MSQLYQDRIMSHYRSTRNRGVFERPSFCIDRSHTACGDTVSIQGLMEGDMLVRILFQGSGCILSQAAASLLADHIQGMTIEQILALGPLSMRQLLGMELGPGRMQCILLPLQAVQEGVKEAITC